MKFALAFATSALRSARAAIVATGALLMETGDYLLLESGSKILLE